MQKIKFSYLSIKEKIGQLMIVNPRKINNIYEKKVTYRKTNEKNLPL